jgi:DNA modification methylase
LRDYGVGGQLGLEPTPDTYVAAMVEVFREVRRVLADDGTLWLNLGDSYVGPPRGNKNGWEGSGLHGIQSETYQATLNAGTATTIDKSKLVGLKPKDLVGIPWMVAFALRADGWYLRSDIIWSKPNPMPESVTDRPTKAHEYLFLLSKAQKYYYDADAIREPSPESMIERNKYGRVRADNKWFKGGAQTGGQDGEMMPNPDGRNKRTVWTVTTQPYPEAHFATFPEALIEPCILAGSALEDTVLDPFTGSGTTGAVAIRHQRSFVGCELNPVYVELARQRIGKESPLFAMEGSS